MNLSFVLCIHYFTFDVVCVNSNSKWNRKVSLKIQYGYHPVSHSEANITFSPHVLNIFAPKKYENLPQTFLFFFCLIVHPKNLLDQSFFILVKYGTCWHASEIRCLCLMK